MGCAAAATARPGDSTYLRLSTKPIEQALLEPAIERLGVEALRREVLAGAIACWCHRTPWPMPRAS